MVTYYTVANSGYLIPAVKTHKFNFAAMILTIHEGKGEDGIAIGFEGGSWRTHPDILSVWLEVPMACGTGRFWGTA
jgi:hypothetical protein